jgi:hypothetical protein
MPSFDNLNHRTVDMRQETAAIYTIVSRSVKTENWLNLSPEARTQIILEANTLLKSQLIPPSKKKSLLTQAAKHFTTEIANTHPTPSTLKP